MKHRLIAAALTAGFGLSLLASSANAAISVLGNGLAQDCFQAAEFGGDPKDGVATCTTALEETALTTRDRAATMVNRGILRSRIGDLTGALDDYNHGLTVDATLGEGYVDRGATEILMHSYDSALADIDKGIALNANKLEIAYYDRAIVNEALGNVRDAYFDYKKASELRPDFALANEQLLRFKVVRKASANGT